MEARIGMQIDFGGLGHGGIRPDAEVDDIPPSVISSGTYLSPGSLSRIDSKKTAFS
jgi:hypothetical protein